MAISYSTVGFVLRHPPVALLAEKLPVPEETALTDRTSSKRAKHVDSSLLTCKQVGGESVSAMSGFTYTNTKKKRKGKGKPSEPPSFQVLLERASHEIESTGWIDSSLGAPSHIL